DVITRRGRHVDPTRDVVDDQRSMPIRFLHDERPPDRPRALHRAYWQRDEQRKQNRESYSQHHTLLDKRSRRYSRTGKSRRGSFKTRSSSCRTEGLPESSNASINESCTSGDVCIATALTSSPCPAGPLIRAARAPIAASRA